MRTAPGVDGPGQDSHGGPPPRPAPAQPRPGEGRGEQPRERTPTYVSEAAEPQRPPGPDQRAPVSSHRVNGPSFTSSTAISAPKRPVPTGVTPAATSCEATRS